MLLVPGNPEEKLLVLGACAEKLLAPELLHKLLAPASTSDLEHRYRSRVMVATCASKKYCMPVYPPRMRTRGHMATEQGRRHVAIQE